MTRVIVVGGGLSGLAAAWRLERSGVDVTVLEMRGHVGGRVRTERVGDYLVDTGPDAATAGFDSWLRLVEDLGMSGDVAETSRVLGVVRHGRVIDIDVTKPLRAAFTPALSWAAKLRLAAGIVRLRKPMAKVDSYQLNLTAELDDPDTDAYEFALRYFGREAADYVIDGAVRLVTSSGAREASCLSVLGALTGWSQPTVNIRGGLARVPDGVAARLRDVRLNAEVTSVEESATGVVVTCNGERLEADGCVIASMYHSARTIWPRLDDLAPDFGARLKPAKMVSTSLGYTRQPNNDCYIVAAPTADEPDMLLMFLQHNKAPDRAPAGHSLITLYTDTLATDQYMTRTDDEIVDWAAGVVERLCPELRGRRDMGHVTRWPNAGYLADPGYWRRSKALLAAQPADSRIRLAGDLFGAGSMESSVRWGERAADALLADCLASSGNSKIQHSTRVGSSSTVNVT